MCVLSSPRQQKLRQHRGKPAHLNATCQGPLPHVLSIHGVALYSMSPKTADGVLSHSSQNMACITKFIKTCQGFTNHLWPISSTQSSVHSICYTLVVDHSDLPSLVFYFSLQSVKRGTMFKDPQRIRKEESSCFA